MLQSGHLRYASEECKIHLCSIEMRKPDYTFLPPDYNEVTQAITKKISLERLLKLIHYKFFDQGLTSTLIHQIYASSENEICYYVPELVYIAVRKMCKPMRKVLVSKSATSESLRRLEVVGSAPDKKKFTDSEKAISMLANASLILKKMPKEEMKDKLKKFIKRFNHEILNNLEHCIMIPFRRNDNEKVNSSFVTRIIEDNCSCFPTRKRVPYRIILETIDIEEFKRNHHEMGSSSYFKQENVLPDKDRDLFDEVKTEIERLFKPSQSFLIIDNKYPFVIDQEEFVNNTKLNNFQKNIESKEKNEKENEKLSRTREVPIIKRETVEEYMSRARSSRGGSKEKLVFNKGEVQIMDTEKYRKFCTIFIPTLPSSLRKSDSDYPTGLWITVDKDHFKKRLSERAEDLIEEKNVKVIEEEVKYDGTAAESVWKEPWSQTLKTLKQFSPFKKFESLRFRNMVVKGGDDLRQEIICMQLIYKMQAIIKEAHVDVFIKPYEIIVLSENSGMLEFVSNSISIDGMKKDMDLSLPEFYNEVFNTEPKFLKAKDNFIRSLAGSSILTYVLKLKDRHNGNILLDIDGNIIHIDFGFILGMSPGGLNFESSPFKFTEEYVLLLGGKNSPDYKLFEDLFCDGMMALRKRCVELCLMLHIMMEESDLECFRKFSIEGFKEVFQEKMTDADYTTFCKGLVELSCCNSRTANYDYFQKMTNGINP